ncbi:hypothetical protein UAW_01886 [Enterococcus haemoperoxidus ATCC BAA-382]|uniref:Phage protein n=1 Tax=Enterococcus haemoperoxidus ATCC BAA-382 TaxID=1158608 RepID=R2SV86_9ENTE|nr:hypothetical protein [Enterococcus haemoperoxidus]EOH96721.1 hypothetical protein UAW_01886 [Enterococcus haemoperoxidus ATCC BAA-382]EOT60217.1 hypothetical protein I583_02852 [Enterococcus haemoperoxidus ATCC BAA-382]
MENKHSTDGIAEDLIRSFVQIASTEMHAKTLLEKRVSELENGLIDLETDLETQLQKITEYKEEITTLAELRRTDMLYLFDLYGSRGDKEKWCTVKHLSIAMMTAFEAWQASNQDEALLSAALAKNKLFIKALTQFLGVEVTECAACFADIIKGGKNNG